MSNRIHLAGLTGMMFLTLTIGPGMTLRADERPAQKEHAAAEADHVAWLKQLRSMRAEHQRALAALKRLEAEILEHEAELEDQIAEIEEHRHHIHEHEAAIADGKEAESDKDHETIEKRHAEIAKSMDSAHEDHKHLIAGLMKFVKDHLEKFHDHHKE